MEAAVPGVGRRAAKALAVAALLGGMITLGLLPCPFALVTRHPCPGCGMTRATLALLRGDLRSALHFHPLVLVILPTLIVFFGVNGLMYLRRGSWNYLDSKSGKWWNRAIWLYAAVALAVWISRFFGAFGGPAPVLAMGELAVLLTSMVTSAVVTGGFVLWDRRRSRRRDVEWYEATTINAVFGGMLGVHFVPAFLCCGLRVFATRGGRLGARIGWAALTTTVMLIVQLLVLTLALELLGLLGVPVPRD